MIRIPIWSIYIKIDDEWLVALGQNTHHFFKATAHKVIRNNFENEEVQIFRQWLVIL